MNDTEEFLVASIARLQNDKIINSLLGTALLQSNPLLGAAVLTDNQAAKKAAIIQEIEK